MHFNKRTKARELAMQALYQLDIQAAQTSESITEFLLESESDILVRNLAAQWCKDTWANLDQCDELITNAIIKWQLSRLSPVDRSILRLGVYQLKFHPDIPPKVVINEAIELAKKYSSVQSSGFVNGVLDAIRKKIEPENNKSKADKEI